MNLKILSLNCQRGYQPELEAFLTRTLKESTYNFLLLQEVSTKKVLPLLQSPSYDLVRTFNTDAGEESEVTIVYRKSYELTAQGFLSFSSMRNDPFRGFSHPSFGFMWAEFFTDGKALRLASIHLHSGIDSNARMVELKKAKEILIGRPQMPTILSGDFNAGYPGEGRKMARLLAPEFAWISRDIGSTLDSRYSENVAHLPNRIAAALAAFGIGIPVWTDQAFVDQKTAETAHVECRILPDRVSDHSPVEVSIENLN